MTPNWYTVCLPTRLALAVMSYFSFFSYVYLIIGIGFFVSFILEYKNIKLFHAAVWAGAYFGGVAAFVLIVVDIVVSIAKSQMPQTPQTPQPDPVYAVPVVEPVVEPVATKMEVI